VRATRQSVLAWGDRLSDYLLSVLEQMCRQYWAEYGGSK
jgi:hypothetical protein